MKWNDGDLVHGFRVSRMSHIEEVNADAYLMEHVKSGARLLYLDSDMIIKFFIFVSARRRIIPRVRRISWSTRRSAARGNIR